MSGVTEFETFDDFMGHRGSTGGGQRLKGWKDKGSLDAWLHTKRLPIGVWRHPFPDLIVIQKDDKVEKMIFPVSLVCWEDEAILKAQYKRKPDGTREVPPLKCAMCKMIEHVHMMVLNGEIDWTTPIFRFEGADDPMQNCIVHAGGFYGAFQSRRLTDDQKKELRKAKIFQKVAWKENSNAKLSYVFPIVDNNNVAGGVQITIEPDLLKQKVVNTISKERESEGVEAGDPTRNPYCIRFVYREQAEDLKEKYDALRVRKIEITDEIKRLITAEPPDLKNFLTPFNAGSLLAKMQRRAVDALAKKNFPWEEIFGDIEPEEEEEDEDLEFPPSGGSSSPKKKNDDDDNDDDEDEDDDEEEESPPPKKKSSKKDKKAENPEPKSETKVEKTEDKPAKKGRRPVQEKPEKPKKNEEGDPCDVCKAPMKKGQLECNGCGTKYENDADSGDDA